MSEHKHKTQAEKASASKSSKKQNSKAASKKEVPKKDSHKKDSPKEKAPSIWSKIPVRFLSSAIFLILFIVFLVIFFGPDGALTNLFENLVLGLVGTVGYVVAIPAFLYLFIIHAFSAKRPVIMRSVCIGVFVLVCGSIAHLGLNPSNEPAGMELIGFLYTGGIGNITGGVICGGIAMLLKWLLGVVLTYIVLIATAVMTLLGAMQITIPSIIRAIQNRPRADWEDEEEQEPQPEPAAIVVNHIANKRIKYVQSQREKAAQEQDIEPIVEEAPSVKAPAKKEDRVKAMMQEIDADVDTTVIPATEETAVADEQELLIPETIVPLPSRSEDPKESNPSAFSPDYDQDIIPEQMPAFDPVKPVQNAPKVVKPRKVTPKEAEASAALVEQEIQHREKAEPEPVAYCYPPIDLLKRPTVAGTDGTEEMRENSRRLSETLESFKIEARIINVTRGPSVTRYEVELEKGVRLSKLTSASVDIALSLGASGVRIAAVPGKISVVGIEVPNQSVTMVSLREVIDSPEFVKAKSKSSFAVGKDIGGSCIVGNIAKLPHMLIAGTTGSGKSVCMNSIIISLLYKASPDDVKLIMIDPKMVELGIYNSIPHLLIPVVTDPKKAAGSLQWAVTEMMRRYKAMSDVGVRDLESYNSIVAQEEGGKKLPQVVVIIDELADLMLVAAKEVEESICRIAQMGRAAGMHLVIATQRPSADVITGLMKANIPSRIAFAVSSAMESRIILDTQGAEKLVGKGDMLFAPVGCGKPLRVQGCFVSDGEVEAVANYVKENYTTSYDQDVMEEIERKAAQTGNKPAAADPEPSNEELEGDEMLPAAVDVILETGQASVSMLQRRLKLGYARAARIVDEMEEKGIVGPFQGSKPRAILVTKEQWEAMRAGGAAQMTIEDYSDEDGYEEDDVEF